jgi:hypothetical protein
MGEQWKKEAGGWKVRTSGNSLGEDLVRDGFFRAQARISADLKFGKFFFACRITLA